MLYTNELCGTEFQKGAFCVVIFAADSVASAEKIWCFLQCNATSAVAQGETYQRVVYQFERDVILVANFRAGLFYTIKEAWAQTFHTLVEQNTLGALVMGIGSEEDRFERICRSYDRARTCVSARLAMGDNRIFSCDETKWPAPNQCEILSVEIAHSLSNALINRNMEAIKVTTAMSLDGVVNQAKSKPFLVLYSLRKILSIYEENCECLCHNSRKVKRYFQKRRKELEAASCFEDVYGMFRNIIQDVASATNASSLNPRNHSAVLKMRKYIEDNYQHDVSLAELAAIVGMNRNYICELFKQGTGVSIHQYLIRQRLERVKILLNDSNHSIAQIARQVGYPDDKYLSVQFKKRYGITPGEYRKKTIAVEL